MRSLLIFLDGVGLGPPAPDNPFIFTETPYLKSLLESRPLCLNATGFHGARASLIGLDAVMGIKGLPQSATGQSFIIYRRKCAPPPRFPSERLSQRKAARPAGKKGNI